MFGQIIDSIAYAWHDHDKFRHWFKALTCPCLCCCFCIRWTKSQPFGRRRNRRLRPDKRQTKMSEITRNRRARQFQNRKRSVSVDGKKESSKANEQLNSLFFSMLPPELRLKIYELVLRNPKGLEIMDNNTRFKDYYRIMVTNLCPLDLLRTCKRM